MRPQQKPILPRRQHRNQVNSASASRTPTKMSTHPATVGIEPSKNRPMLERVLPVLPPVPAECTPKVSCAAVWLRHAACHGIITVSQQAPPTCLSHFACCTWCTSSRRNAEWRWWRCQRVAVHKGGQVLAFAGGPARIAVAPAQFSVPASIKSMMYRSVCKRTVCTRMPWGDTCSRLHPQLDETEPCCPQLGVPYGHAAAASACNSSFKYGVSFSSMVHPLDFADGMLAYIYRFVVECSPMERQHLGAAAAAVLAATKSATAELAAAAAAVDTPHTRVWGCQDSGSKLPRNQS